MQIIIKFTKKTETGGAVATTGICGKVQGSDQLKPYLDSTLPGQTEKGKMAIGSTTKIY